MTMMKAIALSTFGGPEVLELTDLPKPTPKPGEVLIRVRAFGINRIEAFLRQGLFGPLDFPRVLGIEAVGQIVDANGTDLSEGATVATATGGMGHGRDGGYAEYLAVPVDQAQVLVTSLGWAQLGALPEIMQTAWGALHFGIAIKAGQSVLIRGGTTAVGLGAIGLAKAAGLRVIATTRKPDRAALLRRHGADDVLIDDGRISENVRGIVPDGVDGAIELVGASSLIDTMKSVRTDGAVVIVGMLEPKASFDNFRPLMELPSRVGLVAYRGGKEEFMATPLQSIVKDIEEGRIVYEVAESLSMARTAEAHGLMETNAAGGKIVVTVD